MALSTARLAAGLIPAAAHSRLAELERIRGDTRLLHLVLGSERIWEVIYSIVAPTDPVLKQLFPPLPPETLRRIVSDWQAEMFLWTGFVDIETFLRIADEHLDVARADLPRILDFGGGCGRLSRYLDLDGAPWDASLCDVNGDMVSWCAANLRRVKCFRNEALPPLACDAGSFDLLLGLSVFTHLDLNGLRRWLQEFERITAPGGLAIVTTHGPRVLEVLRENSDLRHWFRLTPARVDSIADEFERSGFVFVPYDDDVLAMAQAGASYGTTFVSSAMVAAIVKDSGFELVEHRPAGLRGWQDIVVLRRQPEGR